MNDVREVLEQARTIWFSGGWAMIALAVNAMILFGIGINLWLKFRAKGFKRISEKRWRQWITDPSKRSGPVGRLIGFVMGAQTLEDLNVRFAELQATEVSPYGRDLRFMKRCVSTAPLLGLLGTVTGMLTTFNGMAMGPGGQKTMDLVAGGISEALITTETGLVIALPGLFFQYHLKRDRDRYQAFLAHLETVCAQYLWRSTCAKGATATPQGAGS